MIMNPLIHHAPSPLPSPARGEGIIEAQCPTNIHLSNIHLSSLLLSNILLSKLLISKLLISKLLLPSLLLSSLLLPALWPRGEKQNAGRRRRGISCVQEKNRIQMKRRWSALN